MKNRAFIILVLLAIAICLNAQNAKYSTETSKDIYWQPERKIEFSDYQSISKEVCVKYNEKYGVHIQGSIGFRWAVDIPKKWKGKIDKGYIIPVFCKNCSCILSEDTLELKTDQLLFDITEVCARRVRIELDNIQKEMNIDNPNSMFFISVKNKWEENKRNFLGGAINEILIEKQEGAYEKWRKSTDEFLEETKDLQILIQ